MRRTSQRSMRLLCKESQWTTFILLWSRRAFGLLHFCLHHCDSQANGKKLKLSHPTFFLQFHKNTKILKKKKKMTCPKSFYEVIFGLKNRRLALRIPKRKEKTLLLAYPASPDGLSLFSEIPLRTQAASFALCSVCQIVYCFQHCLLPQPLILYIMWFVFFIPYQYNPVKCTLL